MKAEIISIAEDIAREKGITSEQVVSAMELAIQRASRVKYGLEKDIRAKIDRNTGAIIMHLYKKVVEVPEDYEGEIALDQAILIKPDIQIGDFIQESVPPLDLGRVAAQTARQVVFQEIREIEREKQYEEFKDKVGEVVNAAVKRIEYGNLILDLQTAEGIIFRRSTINRESVRVGERIRAYIEEVRREPKGSQIFLSRTHPQFLAKLFAQEVPEIYDGQIEIKAVARDPGSRAKFAVYMGDKSIDPIGICVGVKGNRIQAVTRELQGEKIDVIPWSDNPATFIVNALVPAEVSKVVLDEDTGKAEIVVTDDKLSLAIGRGGQNVRLARELTGWDLKIMSESEASEKRVVEFKHLSKLFIEALDVDDVIAHLLISEGFKTIEEIVAVPVEELVSIEGFEEEIAAELQLRANKYLQEQEKLSLIKLEELGFPKEIIEQELLSVANALTLTEKEIVTLENIADLSNEEMQEILPDVSLEQANEVIMYARKVFFG